MEKKDNKQNSNPIERFLAFQDGEKEGYFLAIAGLSKEIMEKYKTAFLEDGLHDHAQGLMAGYDWGLNDKKHVKVNIVFRQHKLEKNGNSKLSYDDIEFEK